jgi:hypothetical protein
VKDQLFKKLSTREVDFSFEIDEESPLYSLNGIELLAKHLVEEYAKVRKGLEEVESPARNCFH